jgi:hypothetical protein
MCSVSILNKCLLKLRVDNRSNKSQLQLVQPGSVVDTDHRQLHLCILKRKYPKCNIKPSGNKTITLKHHNNNKCLLPLIWPL